MKVVNKKYIIVDETVRIKDDTISFENHKQVFHIHIQDKEYQDIKEIPQEQLSKMKALVFVLDFSQSALSFKEADDLMVAIKKIGKWARCQQLVLGIKQNENRIIACIKRGSSQYEANVETAIGVLTYQDKIGKYEYIYDEICTYLDEVVVGKNLCQFENDTCIAKRNTNCTMGCCHHYKNKYFGILYERKLQLCEYLVNKRCEATCITCKMFMCDELKKRGTYFTNRNVLPIQYYLNPIQKIIIRTSFFTPKEKILKKICRVAIR